MIKRHKSAAAAGTTIMSRPPVEWLRCSEGFQLTEEGHGSNSQPCEKEILDSGAVNANQHKNRVKPRRQFGQKWIQSEELLQVSGCLNQKSRSRNTSDSSSVVNLDALSSHTTAEDTDNDSICWNNSDSDTEDVKKQETRSPPTKILRTSHPAQKNKQKRKSAKARLVPMPQNFELDQSSGSESEDAIVSASDSEEEKTTFTNHGKSHHSPHQSSASSTSCKERSPGLHIECTGSPEHSSTSTPDGSDQFAIRDPEEAEEDEHCLTWQRHQVCSQNPQSPCKDPGGTPSISSCVSSQLTADSDVSPVYGSLRASEWVKQVKWETTPTKHPLITPPHQGDSGKKKKKFARGGLAEQMSRILQREKSARRMWQHQHKAEDTSQGSGSKSVSVKVKGLETVYSLQMARCSVVWNSSSRQHSANPQCFVLFSPQSSQRRAAPQPGATVHIYPPWQQVDTSTGKILLCTRYHVTYLTPATSQGSGEDSEGHNDNDSISLSSSPLESHGSWMCPCSSDVNLTVARCPAHLFPFLPSSVTQNTRTTQHKEQSRTGKMLHTVTCNKGTPKRTLTFNTLLESIEKAPAGDRLLPAFQATVLRVFCEQQEAGSKRWSLLVEDSQGTVGVVSGADPLSELEGCLCSFSCLRVQSRTNADRDPALFSAVCGAWCDRLKSITTSQDSGKVAYSDDSEITSQHMAQPPGFCYVLELDRSVCDVLVGEDWLTVSTSSSFPHTPPPLVLSSLAHALQNQQHNGRVSVLGKFLYFSEKMPTTEDSSQNSSTENNAQNTSVLFITDHSLQKEYISDDNTVKSLHKGMLSSQGQNQNDSQSLPAYVTVEVRQDCVSDGVACESGRVQSRSPTLVLLRDVWIVNGTWIADKYCSMTSSETNSKEATVLRTRIDPDLHKRVSQCGATFPLLSASSQTGSLVSLSGKIQGVDEKSAFSWEECDGCGSDQLATKTGSGPLTCLKCRKQVSCPVQRMKMEVTMCENDDPSLTVGISLQQSTIEELLPDEEDEEGYDVECVLNKSVGPVNCIITSTTPTTTGISLTAVQLPS